MSHPESLERSPERLLTSSALGVPGCGKWMPAQVVVSHPETLERLKCRLLERSILRGDLVLVKGGAVGVNVDDGVSRRHFDEYLFGMFYYRNSVFMLNSDNMKNDNSFLPSGSNDNPNLAFLKNLPHYPHLWFMTQTM